MMFPDILKIEEKMKLNIEKDMIVGNRIISSVFFSAMFLINQLDTTDL